MERKAIFLGDSITEGVGVSDESKTYWSLVGKALNLQVKHYGVSGTRIAPQLVEINKDWSESFIDRAKIMDKDADIVCVFGGTNDYGHGDLPIGKLGDTLPVTFYRALHTLFTYLYQTYPDSYIFL